MKKAAALLLAFVLALPSVCFAQEAPSYVPGEITTGLLADAWTEGKLISAELSMDLAADESAIVPEEARQIRALAQFLDSAAFTLGFGMTEEGLRIEAGAGYAGDPSDPVAVDAALTVSEDGLALASSLLPGECVSIRWETLFLLAGMDEAQVRQITALRGADPEVLLQNLIEQLEPYMELAENLLTPYLEIVSDSLSSLKTEVAYHLPATDAYPAAARQISLYITAQDIGLLLSALSDQLSGDTQMQLIAGMVLSALTDGDLSFADVAEFCSDLRTAAAELSESDARIVITAADGSDGSLLYASMSAEAQGSSMPLITYVLHPASPGTPARAVLNAGTFDAQGKLLVQGVSAVCTAQIDSEDVYDVSLSLDIITEGIILGTVSVDASREPHEAGSSLTGHRGAFSVSLRDAQTKTDDRLTVSYTSAADPAVPAVRDVTFSMDISSGSDQASTSTDTYTEFYDAGNGLAGFRTIQDAFMAADGSFTTSHTVSEFSQTADGGEQYRSTGTSIADESGEQYTIISSRFLTSTPDIPRIQCGVSASIAGVCDAALNADVTFAEPRNISGLPRFVLDTATSAEVDDLLARVGQNAEALLGKLEAQLPPEVLELLSE